MYSWKSIIKELPLGYQLNYCIKYSTKQNCWFEVTVSSTMDYYELFASAVTVSSTMELLTDCFIFLHLRLVNWWLTNDLSVQPTLVQIEHMDALFEAQFSPLSESGRALSKCGKCARYMKYISPQPPRLFCSTCEDVYYLPQKGSIKVYISLLRKLFTFVCSCLILLFKLGSVKEWC